jgi:hypothetical protein
MKLPLMETEHSSEPDHLVLDLSQIPSATNCLSLSRSKDDEQESPKIDLLLSPNLHDVISCHQTILTSDLIKHSKELRFRQPLSSHASIHSEFRDDEKSIDSIDLEELSSHLRNLKPLSEWEKSSSLQSPLPSTLLKLQKADPAKSSVSLISSSSSGASDTAFLSHHFLPHSQLSPSSPSDTIPISPDLPTTSMIELEDHDDQQFGFQMIVDRNRQKFIQRYLVTSAVPIRRSYSLSSFDYANAIADTFQYAEDDRQSLNSVSQSYGERGGDNLFDEYELGAAIGAAMTHENVSGGDRINLSSLARAFPPPISPPHPPPFPQFSVDSVDYLDHTSNSPLTPPSIRQGASSTSHIAPSGPSTSQRTLNCFICEMNEPNACFLSCGHGGICYPCAILIVKKYTNQCPFCRKEIVNLFKISKRYSYSIGNRLYQFGVCHEGYQILGKENGSSRKDSQSSGSHQRSSGVSIRGRDDSVS